MSRKYQYSRTAAYLVEYAPRFFEADFFRVLIILRRYLSLILVLISGMSLISSALFFRHQISVAHRSLLKRKILHFRRKIRISHIVWRLARL